MIKLRLTQTGKKHQRQYRIVAIESTSKRDGRAVETIGIYAPLQKNTVQLNKAAAEKWLKIGAQPSATVAGILKKEGVIK